ncbi:MAG: hypothetical protein WAR83_14795 [Flavobacteriales bacterium]
MKWLLVISCWLSTALAGAQEVHIPLHDGWSFCQVGKEQWYPAEVPGVVHTDLLRNGLIPDPYLNSNVDSVQWIENEAWIYKRTIIASDTLLKHGHLDLVFKGLDTFAEVYLNDTLLFKADNMFRTWEWPVKELLRKGENELKVIFRSPIKEGAKLRDAYGIQLPHDNDPTGVSPYIRKAAYQFGWDFCPRLVTSGIWKGVELHGWDHAWIGTVTVEQDTGSPSEVWNLQTFFHSGSDAKVQRGLRYKVFVNDVLEINRKAFFERGCWGHPKNKVRALRNTVIEPWFPDGYGKQPVYRLRVELWRKGMLLDTYHASIANRKVELDQQKDSIGIAFTFRINGITVFAKGCNLIPPDMFPSRITDSTWVSLVGQMQAANMNMVRVWSGGVYPPEAFYSACDTAGIMVWQDYMFGNMVPGNKEFLDNAMDEIDEIQLRTWDHPCLVTYCGNNELEVAWINWGWQDRYSLHGPDSIKVERANNYFFEQSIQNVSSDLNYTPTSPLSNWGNAKGLTEGDLHYWGVWHGDSAFSSFKNNVGRFVSEYGFQSYPDSTLLANYIDPKEIYLGSPAVQHLQRSYKTDKPIWEAIERELGEERPTTLGGFIEANQRVQAKAYGMAIEAHMSAQPHCMGTLLWQLNDCWPGPSWSIIDYEGRPKPAYQVVRSLYLKEP